MDSKGSQTECPVETQRIHRDVSKNRCTVVYTDMDESEPCIYCRWLYTRRGKGKDDLSNF